MLYNETFPEQLTGLEKSGQWVSMVKADGDNFQVKCKQLSENLGSKRIIRLVNRHENDYTKQFPEIVAGLGVRRGINCVLNGEIAYWDEENKIFNFNLFRGRQGLQKDREITRRRLLYPCKIYVFDLIEYGGIPMVNNPDYPFSKRYGLLKQIVHDNNVTKLLPIRTDLVTHFKEECNANREGIMVKSLNNIYADNRTQSVLKCKNWPYSIVRFTGYENCPSGIVLINDIDRVLCANQEQAEEIKATIIQLGHSEEVIRHLQNRTDNGKMREPSWKPKEKYLNMCNPTYIQND